MIQKLADLEKEVEKILLIEDNNLVRVVCASIIANRMEMQPVWLFLVAPPSGSKSEIINCLTGLDFIYPISTITVNSFLSGQAREGKETSLLLRLKGNSGIFAFKDFTTILSMNQDARREIMSQLREIYDGEFSKSTGSGHNPKWKGKVGAIAGVTGVVHEVMQEFNVMGGRFIQYEIIQPNRKKATMRAIKNRGKMKEYRSHLKKCFQEYLNHVIDNLNEEEIQIDDKTMEEFIEIANFAALARSAVTKDFRTGRIKFVPQEEMPMRIAEQLTAIASALIAMRKSEEGTDHTNELTETEKNLIYKIGLDTIPIMRRWTIQMMARFKGGITTAGFAEKINYPTETVKAWLEEMNALGFCERAKKGTAHTWWLKEEYRKIMVRFENIDVSESSLDSDNLEEESGITPDDSGELDRIAKEINSNLFNG
jgi:hypothetical protein